MAGWNESQLRKYNIKLEKLPILQYDDPKVDLLLSNNVSSTLFCGSIKYIQRGA